MRAGKPPHFLFTGARRREKWTRLARVLLHGFQMYEDSLCGGCGQSAFHTLSDVNSRRFTSTTETCWGCVARETFAKNHKGDSPGLKVFVKNTMGPDVARDWE